MFFLALLLAIASGPLVAQSGPLGSIRVTSPRVNVRAEPSLRGAVLTQVTAGTVLPLHGVEGDWFRVRLQRGSLRLDAYISSTVSERIAPAEGAGTAEPGAAGADAPSEPRGLTTGPPVERHGLSAGHLLIENGSRGLPPATAAWRVSLEVNGSPAEIARAMPAPGSTMPALPNGAEVSYVWLLDSTAEVPALGDRQPRLIVQFQDVEGLDPEDLTVEIVRLAPAPGGGAVVSVVRGRVDQRDWPEADWDVRRGLREDTVRVNRTLLAPGTLHIQPSSELAPGDYALVVRPDTRTGVSGANLLAAGPLGKVFSVVWPFRVAPR